MVYNASAAAYLPPTSGTRYIMDINKVVVRVPATTANLGSGFDCLGMALEVHNTVTAQVVPSGLDVRISGEGEEALRWGEENRVLRAMRLVYQQANRRLPGLRLDLENTIPLGRGLGSSAAASVGGLVAANALCDHALTTDQLLALAVRLEGHPDNVAPALLGGLVVAITEGDHFVCAPVPVPTGLVAAAFVPDFAMPTDEARRVLPGRIDRADAVFNLGRAALLVAAFATDRPDLLDQATGDRLHQPYRQAIFPAMPRLFDAARAAGSRGVFLSGSGSTILALAVGEESAAAVAEAMATAAQAEGIGGKTLVARVSAQGAQVEVTQSERRERSSRHYHGQEHW
jgi:homoserine kinase